jgi:hypothetical protein
MKIKYIIILFILSGLFYFRIPDIKLDRFYPAQYAFFIFSSGILGSYLIYQKNKWLGFIFALCSLGFLKTYLLQHAPLEFIFKTALFGSAVFLTYYFVRQQKLNEDILKWFLIPAYLNIALIIVQRFDHNFLSFMPVNQISGFLGNRGMTGCFLMLTTPLFFKFKQLKLLPLLLLALYFSSILALICSLALILFYLWKIKSNWFKPYYLVLSLILVFIGVFYRGKIIGSLHIRASTIVGTLDGIKHNPILGWGLGSFEPVMIKASQDKLTYLGIKFNNPQQIMGHPHNEILLGWWNFGLTFPILIILFLKDFFKKLIKENLIPFLIVLGGIIFSNFYFLPPPVWFLMMIALGIYENKKEEICQ